MQDKEDRRKNPNRNLRRKRRKTYHAICPRNRSRISSRSRSPEISSHQPKLQPAETAHRQFDAWPHPIWHATQIASTSLGTNPPRAANRAENSRRSRKPARQHRRAAARHDPDALTTATRYPRNRMSRTVQHRPHQIIHPGIDNDERFAPALFHIQHSRQQNSRRPDDGATRLQQKVRPQRPHIAAIMRA